jgi:ABC-type dipeptide/oligopeptide/nickel transport system permease subunit
MTAGESLRHKSGKGPGREVTAGPQPGLNYGRGESDEVALAGRSFRRRVLAQTNARIGLILLGVMVLACLFGPIFYHQSPVNQNLAVALEGPSAQHLLGTDEYGRDELARLLYGGRYSITLGVVAVIIGIAIGMPIGAASGYFGGQVDVVLQRITEVFMSFPGILLALALVAALGVNLQNILVAVTVSSLPVFIRLARASALTIRELPYIEAARSLGSSRWRNVFVHVMPNSIAPIAVQASLQVGLTILTAAGLGFLGLGVPPPDPEWGEMLGDAQTVIFRDPWLAIFPGIAIFLVVIGFNLLGDGLRSVLDPRELR